MMTYDEINAVVSELKAGDHIWLRVAHESGNTEDATGVVWQSDNGYLCLGPRVIRWPEGKHPEGLQALALLIPA